MLDDLKKDRQAGLAAQERVRLSLYVGMLILLGSSIWMGSQCSSKLDNLEGDEPIVAAEEGEAPVKEGPTLDPVHLDSLVRDSGSEPERWAEPAIEELRRVQRRGSLGRLVGPVAAKDLAAAKAPAGTEGALRGRMVDVLGRVTEVAREVYRPGHTPTDSERLWTVVMEGEDGTPFVGIKYAVKSEVAEGQPEDLKPPQVNAERIKKGHWVVVRGVYVQDRVGSFGDQKLGEPAPIIYATQWRIVYPPEQRNPLISSLDEALWSEVDDRFMGASRNWEEDAVYETIQWARAVGHDKIKAMLDSGELPWQVWATDRFEAWRKEVVVEDGDERPLTTGSRGKVFRISGVVGDVLHYGWESIPRNPWGVSEFHGFDVLSDHYQNVAFRAFVPFPVDTFEGVEGKRKEHIHIYGVFVKNLTYDSRTKREDGSGRQHPITAPMFVVIHAEPVDEQAAIDRVRQAMVWVAIAMVVFGLLFYLVLIRGGQKSDKRMEKHRLALRKRARAAGQGAMAPDGPVTPAADSEPPPAAPPEA